MSFYDKYILPRIIDWGCGQKIMQQQRERVVPMARGRVLEIGIGSGLNLPFYDTKNIDTVIGLDPSAEMLAMARERSRGLTFPVEFVQLGSETIPLEDHSVDTVLLTFALCTIPDTEAALAQMRRVLKPGGELIFCEHGRAPDTNIQTWQDRVNPLWKRCFGGCNLNRNIPALIRTNGFRIDRIEQTYLPDTPRIAGYRYLGTASVR
jgi:ubiquinone/menaquinone biosynthesis C-methylase UbiE